MAREIILKSHNIILVEIIAALHLDKNHQFRTWVFDPMRCTERNIYRFAHCFDNFRAVECDLRCSLARQTNVRRGGRVSDNSSA